MTPHLPYTPSIEDLAQMYLRLKTRVERIEGMVQQLRAEGNHDAITRPTWRDLEDVKKAIADLQHLLSRKRRK